MPLIINRSSGFRVRTFLRRGSRDSVFDKYCQSPPLPPCTSCNVVSCQLVRAHPCHAAVMPGGGWLCGLLWGSVRCETFGGLNCKPLLLLLLLVCECSRCETALGAAGGALRTISRSVCREWMAVMLLSSSSSIIIINHHPSPPPWATWGEDLYKSKE